MSAVKKKTAKKKAPAKKAPAKEKAPVKKEPAKKTEEGMQLIVITGVTPRMKRTLTLRAKNMEVSRSMFCRLVLEQHLEENK